MSVDRNITRRSFLTAAGIGATGIAVPGAALAASKRQAPIPVPVEQSGAAPVALPAGSVSGDGILVLLTLYGGNDGLDTVIPASDPGYHAARANLAYQPAQVLALRDGIGLHPSLKRMHALFGAGRVAIVQGAGYPNPNRSHFRSMDIWQSAVPETGEITGWLGRWHDSTGADPLRMVNVGASVPRAMEL